MHPVNLSDSLKYQSVQNVGLMATNNPGLTILSLDWDIQQKVIKLDGRNKLAEIRLTPTLMVRGLDGASPGMVVLGRPISGLEFVLGKAKQGTNSPMAALAVFSEVML